MRRNLAASLLLLLAVVLAPPRGAEAQGPQPFFEYLSVLVAPDAVSEFVEADRTVYFDLLFSGRPEPVCKTTDGEEDCIYPRRPPLSVFWELIVSPVAAARVGSSCADPSADVAGVTHGTFRLTADQYALLGIIHFTICRDDYIEDEEQLTLRLVVTDGATRFSYQLPITIEDATPEEAISGVTGGDGVQSLAVSMRERDAGDGCQPLDLLVGLSGITPFEPKTLNFGYETVSGGATDGEDFRIYPTRSFPIPVAARAVRAQVGCILGDDLPEPDEIFRLWFEIAGEIHTRVWITVTIVDNEPASHVPGFLSIQFGAGEALPLVEGDEPPLGLPLVIRYSDGVIRNEPLTFRIVTIDGTALAGSDYVPLDLEVTFPPGHAGLFDLGDQLRLRTVADLVPEPLEEHFYIAVTALIGGEVYFSELLRVGIRDDDFLQELVEGTSLLWLGADPAACPDRNWLIDLPEPTLADGSYVDYAIDVYARTAPPGNVGAEEPSDPDDPEAVSPCGTPGQRFAADVALGPASGDEPAATLGDDVTLTVRDDRQLVFEPIEQYARVHVRVYADDVLEADEHFSIRLSAGIHGVATLQLRIIDAQKRQALAAGRDAAFVRVGRLLGAVVGGALSDRFSCAAATGCAGDIGTPTAELFAPALSRLARGLAASGGAQAGAVPFHPARALAPAIDRIGPLLADLSFSQSPNAWFSVRNPDLPTPWSLWMRTEWAYSSERTAGGDTLDTSVFGLVGGIDRRFGPLTAGALYGWLWAESGRGYRPELAHAEGVDAGAEAFSNHLRWQLVAPYVAVTPHERVRGWMSIGRTFSGSLGQLAGYRPDVAAAADAPEYGMLLGGGSMTALRARGVLLDVEADTFAVAGALPVAPGDLAPAPAAPDATAVPESFDSVALPAAVRHRVALRLGVPLDRTGARRAAVSVSRRWDGGPDIVWAQGSSELVPAYDVGFDVRLSSVASRLSLSITGRLEVSPPRAYRNSDARRAERSLGAVLRFGQAETARGWSVTVRPGYGYPVLFGGSLDSPLMRGVMPGGAFLESLPRVDLDAGYAFADGSRLSLAGGRSFAGRLRPYGAPARASVRYDRGW